MSHDDSARSGFGARPGAAPLRRMVLAQGLMESRLMLRNGEQLLLALVIPLLVLVAGVYGPLSVRLETLVPGVLALAVMSTAFTSLAIATAFERRYGVLKRLGTAPLPRGGLLAGKALAVLLVEAVQFVVIGVAAGVLGWRPGNGAALTGLIVAAVFVAAGTLAFSALGLALAGALRAEATLAAANLIYVVLLVGGAVILPVSAYPSAMQPLVAWLPSGALAEGLRGALAHGSGLAYLGVLVLWTLIGSAIVGRTFRWD